MNELSEIIEISKSFTEKELRPRRAALDASSDETIAALLKTLARIRFFSMLASEEDGGAGQGAVTCAAFIGEVSRVCPALGAALASHAAAVTAVLVCAEESARKEIVARIVEAEERGEAPLFTLCWMEDAVKLGCGLGLEEMETELGGGGAVSGRKIYVPAARAASNFIVLARTEDQSFSFICVAADAGGVIVGEGREMMGLRLCRFSDVTFNAVSSGLLLAGGLSRGDVVKIFARFSAFLGAVCVGMMREAYAQAKSYAAGRYQAGKMIIEHDAIREMLAGMAAGIEKARALTDRAAAETSPANLLCPVVCAEDAVSAALDGIQILGGYGYMKDYPLEMILRDAKTFQTAVVLPQCEKMEYMKSEV